MNLFSKAKRTLPEPDERDEAEQSYRLFKLVSRAWESELKPDTDLRSKSQ